MGKRVLLCVIDGWTPRTFLPALDSGKLPNFRALSRAGHLNPSCVTIFPSITPAALASIVTGGYPKDHGIIGACWYDTSKKEVIYYGDDFWVVLQQGIGRFIRDFLVKLNHQRLQAETIFQKVERAGLRSACLSHLIFRGDVRHQLQLPPLLKLLDFIPGVSLPKNVYGPSILYLGDLASTGTEIPAGLLRRYGFEDNYTADLLIHLVENKALPDFTVAYFPSYDKLSHKEGPEAAMTELENLDTRLGDLFEAFGGLEQMLNELCIVMTADHSISNVKADKASAGIRLDELLSGFQVAGAGEAWSRGDQIKACPNLRAAHIYVRYLTPGFLNGVVQQLRADSRIDQMIHRTDLLTNETPGYYVTTRDRGDLRFWRGNNGSQTGQDEFGQSWSWEGGLQTVDGQVSQDGLITFPTYFNAFERIAGLLDFPDSGDLILTAHPGYEFQLPRTSVHAGGGSHGSLHLVDSLVPLLVAGAPEGIEPPAQPRTVDVAPLCLSILGLAAQQPSQP